MTWLEDFLASKWPGSFTSLAPPLRLSIHLQGPSCEKVGNRTSQLPTTSKQIPARICPCNYTSVRAHTHIHNSSLTYKIKINAVSVVKVTKFALPLPPTNQHRHLGVLQCLRRSFWALFPKNRPCNSHSAACIQLAAQHTVHIHIAHSCNLDRRPARWNGVTWLRWLSTVNGGHDRTRLVQLYLAQFLSSLGNSMGCGATGGGGVNMASSSMWGVDMYVQSRPAACDAPPTQNLQAYPMRSTVNVWPSRLSHVISMDRPVSSFS